MEKKTLHVAKNMQDLLKLTDISKVPFSDVKSICNLLNKLYEEYEKAKLERDDELIFIYVMRFLDIYSKAKKIFRGDTKYIGAIVEQKKIVNALESAENIKKVLSQRYQKEQEISEKIEMETKAEIYSDDPIKLNKLYQSIKDKENILIIDTRDRKEFYKCSIRNSNVINIPSSELKKGSSVEDVEKLIVSDNFQTEAWNNRGSAKLIIVMNWDDNEKEKCDRIIDAIYKYDAKHRCAVKPRLLEGGFKKFFISYPTMVTDCEYQGPGNESEKFMKPDEIFYPNLDKKAKNVKITDKKSNLKSDLKEPSEPNKPTQPINSTDPNKVTDSNKAPVSDELLETNKTSNVIEKEDPADSLNLDKMKLMNGISIPGLTPLTVDRSSKPTTLPSKKDDETKPKQEVASADSEIKQPSNIKVTQSIEVPVDLNEHPPLPPSPKRAHKPRTHKPSSPVTRSPTRNRSPNLEKPNLRMKRSTSQPNLTEENEEKQPLNIAGDEEEKKPPSIPSRQSKPSKLESSEHSSPISHALTGEMTNNSIQPTNYTSSASVKIPTVSQPVSYAQHHSETNIRKIMPTFSEFSATQINNFSPLYKSVHPGLTGLRNLGNTCYMSSVIQALSNTRFLTTYLLQPEGWIQDINTKNPLGHNGVVVKELSYVIRALWSGSYAAVTPFEFKRSITKLSGGSLFAGSEQHDSQEFLAFLLDGLHEDLNKAAGQKHAHFNDDVENDNEDDELKADRAWTKYVTRNDSLIVNLFQGMFRSEVKCDTCAKKSVTFEPFQYLSLPLPSSQITRITLDDCLSLFRAEERMTGPSKWNCPRCKSLQNARKKIDIWKLPPYLLVHLKRFSCSGMHIRHKLSSPVDYPLQLDLGYLLPKKKVQKHSVYHLYAVSNHHGNMESGHYTSYCKNFIRNTWHNFDDDVVTDIRESDVRTPSAYILFYESASIIKKAGT